MEPIEKFSSPVESTSGGPLNRIQRESLARLLLEARAYPSVAGRQNWQRDGAVCSRMAERGYCLLLKSDDPRSQLSEPWQSYRVKFGSWYEKADKKQLVVEIKAEI